MRSLTLRSFGGARLATFATFAGFAIAAISVPAVPIDPPVGANYLAPTGSGTFAEAWPDAPGLNEDFVDDSLLTLTDGAMTVDIPAGSYAFARSPVPGGAAFRDWRVSRNQRGDKEGELEYRVTFNGFDFAKGGKIPGLAGGGDNTGGSHEFLGQTGWSARMMWHGAAWGAHDYPHLKVYYYGADRFDDGTGEEVHLSGISFYATPEIAPNTPITLRQRVRINDPGQANGRIRLWMDDVLVVDEAGLMMAGDYGAQIEYLMADFFRGGNDDGWASTENNSITIDNLTYTTIEAAPVAVAPEVAPAPRVVFDPANYAAGTWTGTGSAPFDLTMSDSGDDPVTGSDEYGPYVQQDGKKMRNTAPGLGATFTIHWLGQIRDMTDGNTTILNLGSDGLLQSRDSQQVRLAYRTSGNIEGPRMMVPQGRIVSMSIVVNDAAKTAKVYRDAIEMLSIDTTGMDTTDLTLFELGQTPLGMRTYGIQVFDEALTPGQLVAVDADMMADA